METQQNSSPLKKYRSPLTSLNRDWKTFMGGYDDPVVRAAAYDMTQRYTDMKATIHSHFLLDAYQMHYRPYDELVPNPLSSNTWKNIIESTLKDPKYRELNQKTVRSASLALFAAENFIDRVTGVAKKMQPTIPQDVQDAVNNAASQNGNQPGNQQGQQGNSPGQPGGSSQGQPFNLSNFFNALQMMQAGSYSSQAQAAQIQNNLSAAIQQAADASETGVEMYNAFSHTGVPMKKLLDPDELRDVISNNIVIALATVLKKLSVENIGKSTTKPAPKRGIPIGVKTMRSFNEITDLIPMEYLNDQDLFSYRVASRKAQVRERFASANKYMVYIDKSGSMGSMMRFMGDWAPKIAVAAGNALALAKFLRSHGGVMVLKLMDTEVSEPITDMWELLKTLASIRADGGTNITKALEDMVENGKDYKCVLASDGIDSIDENAAMNVKGQDVTSILIQTSNPVLEKYTKVVHLNDAGSENIFVEV